MEKTINFCDVIGASSGEHSNMLGKFLYFSLSNVLVDKKELEALCESLGMDCSCKQRLPVADAFKSATGDIRDRITVRRDGEQKFYQIYCRENKSTPNVLSRELVKETVNQRTNQYEKLANIHYDKADQRFGYDDLAYDEDVDAMKYCLQAERLFELYQVCANRKQIETICLKYLRSLEATKVSVNGHLYFVPRHTMEQVAVFETFFEELSRLNRNNTQQFLPHRRRQAARQDDRGVLPGGQKGDRPVPGAGRLLHPVRMQQPIHHGAVGREDPGAGGKEAPLRGHPAPGTHRAG